MDWQLKPQNDRKTQYSDWGNMAYDMMIAAALVRNVEECWEDKGSRIWRRRSTSPQSQHEIRNTKHENSSQTQITHVTYKEYVRITAIRNSTQRNSLSPFPQEILDQPYHNFGTVSHSTNPDMHYSAAPSNTCADLVVLRNLAASQRGISTHSGHTWQCPEPGKSSNTLA